MTVRFSISCILLAAFLLAGCMRLGDSPVGPANDGRELVPVNLSLAIAPEEDGMLSTKTDYEPDTWGGSGKENAIKTLLLLQFEWPDDTNRDGAKLIGQHFMEYSDGIKAKLFASNMKNTVLVIANISGRVNVSNNVTLKDFLERFNGNLISSCDDLWYSDGGHRYLRMSGSTQLNKVTVDNTDLGAVSLKRNCAKVVVRLKNSGSSTVAVDKVMLRNINRKYYYVTNCTGFADPYQAEDPQRFDLAEQAFPDGGVEEIDPGSPTQTWYKYTYYIPANVRGSITNTGQKSKNYQARQGATYFCVHGISSGKDVMYNYYLGADLEDDFNLLPNHKYTYTIDINDKGTPSSDSRIEDTGDVTFTKDANSYMLKPPSWSGATRDYKIPVRRAAVFWNEKKTPAPTDASLALGVYGAGNDTPHYMLDDESQWEVSFVWNEIYKADGTLAAANELLVTSSGTGFSNKYFTIRVANGMRGNAVVALKKKVEDNLQTDPNLPNYVGDDPKYHTNNDILWSWHIWVTDYDPYVPMTVESGTYIYSVPNGEIHRYADKSNLNPAIWGTGGVYVNAFMMDRNLGAEVAFTSPNNPTKSYGLYYQWGRKDPFKTTGSVTTKAADDTGGPGAGSPKQNIRYSIHHPENIITGSNNWTAYETDDPVLGSAAAIWNDHKIGDHGTDNCEAGKSIYDPCPYGWQVPKTGTWSDFSTTTSVWQGSPAAPGRFYREHIWYPAAGLRRDGGVLSFVGSSGNYWSASRSSDTDGISMLIMSGSISPSYGDRRTYGLPVRCVRLSHVLPY